MKSARHERNAERPTITRTGGHAIDNSVETHPAYGQIGASRVSGETYLYGSDFSIIKLKNNLAPNVTFVAQQFGEHMETVTEHARVEVAAYLNAAISRAGLAAFQGEAPPIALPKREEP